MQYHIYLSPFLARTSAVFECIHFLSAWSFEDFCDFISIVYLHLFQMLLVPHKLWHEQYRLLGLLRFLNALVGVLPYELLEVVVGFVLQHLLPAPLVSRVQLSVYAAAAWQLKQQPGCTRWRNVRNI